MDHKWLFLRFCMLGFVNGLTITGHHNPSISAKYKFYRNKITHLKESLKLNYYRSKFENCRNDVKKPGKLLTKLFLQKQKKAK